MSRSSLLCLLVLLCLFSLSFSQPDMPDMPGMGDDMFELQGLGEYEDTPAVFASSKKAAPVAVKKAPPMRAIQYTYEAPVTHLETVTVPTTKTRMAPVIELSKEPVTSKKGGYGYGGGYAGRGLWHTYSTPHHNTPHTTAHSAAALLSSMLITSLLSAFSLSAA